MPSKTPKVRENIPAIDETNVGPNTPDAAVKGGKVVVRRKAITTDEEAWQVYFNLKDKQDKRNFVNGEIAKRYTGMRPRDPTTLRNEGRSWQSNFPTGMMAGIIDRIIPNFLNAIEQQQYLTQATLPEKIDGQDVTDRDKKIETFRSVITRAIRSWPEWRNFNAALVSEIILIGYALNIYTDEDDPWPLFFGQDKAWLHEGSPQYAQYLQAVAFEQPVLIHEFVDKLEEAGDKAKDAGWRLDNCAAALNHASPIDPTRDKKVAPRVYADIIRESSTAQSYVAGAKGIVFGHLFIVEPGKPKGKEGRITHYIMDTGTQKVLFSREKRFQKMSDVVTLFTLEPGNNKFYGSKGVGRMLVNLSIGVDELVNDAVSQMKMSGMMILQTDSKTGMNANIKVRAPFAIINSDGKIAKEQFPTDIEGFVSLYEQLTKIAEVSVGAYIPNVLASDPSAGRRTAREASIDYSRELQTASAYIARFVGQYQGETIHKIQRRLCKKDSTDETAQSIYKELTDKGLNDKEIELLANSPAVANITDLTGLDKQKKAALAQQYRGNPMIDQKKLTEMDIIAQANPEVAKELMITDLFDQTVEAEAMRLQMIELKCMEEGEPMPISPRDADEIHLKVMIPTLKNACTGLLGLSKQNPGEIDPKMLDGLQLAMTHGEAHVQSWEAKLGKGGKDKTKVAAEFFKWMDKVLIEVTKAEQAFIAKAKEELAKQKQIQLRDHLGMPAPAGPGGPESPQPGQDQGPPEWKVKIATSIYKDASNHIKRQVEKMIGFDVTGLPDDANTEDPTVPPTPPAPSAPMAGPVPVAPGVTGM